MFIDCHRYWLGRCLRCWLSVNHGLIKDIDWRFITNPFSTLWYTGTTDLTLAPWLILTSPWQESQSSPRLGIPCNLLLWIYLNLGEDFKSGLEILVNDEFFSQRNASSHPTPPHPTRLGTLAFPWFPESLSLLKAKRCRKVVIFVAFPAMNLDCQISNIVIT